MCQENLIGNINGYPLDDQQNKAATCLRKYSIIVAGAGSGKSTTMIGKIKYLTNYLKVDPQEILCISFTNESTNSLRNNISKNCNIKVEVQTFHKLALMILEDNKINFKLAPTNFLDYIIDEYFSITNNPLAINNVTLFLKNFFYKKSKKEYLNIIKTQDFISFKKLIAKFLNLYFAKYDSIEMLRHFYSMAKNYRDIAFFNLIIIIYRIYEIEKTSQDIIDFDDVIKLATKIINNGGKIRPFKYIIIDEFQDTSSIRLNLIKAIIKKNNSSLTVVGDDFQSIYRFSGCNLDIFLNFKNNFKKSSVLKIENTYRNSQELIDVAGKFIMKNPAQIKKDLKSNKHISKPIKIIYENSSSLKKLLLYLNDSDFHNVLILGRNNFDIKKYINNDFEIDSNGFILLKKCNNLKIRFLTVHKSKGLEADIVIILNLINSSFGFPNKIEDHKILKYINNQDTFPFEEERRLFYVALTRTKNYVYLMTEKNNSSTFVKELLKDYKSYINIEKF